MIKANGKTSFFCLVLLLCGTLISASSSEKIIRLSLSLDTTKYQIEDVSTSWYYKELTKTFKKDQALVHIGPTGLVDKNSKTFSRDQLFNCPSSVSFDDCLTTATIDNILVYDKPFDQSGHYSVPYETGLFLMYYDEIRGAYVVIVLQNDSFFPKSDPQLKYSRILIDRVYEVYNDPYNSSVKLSDHLSTIQISDEPTTK